MSKREGGGGPDGLGGVKTRDDPWMGTVTTVCAFLAGFSLASVVVIAGAPGNFRWPGTAALALTIASVVLVGAAQGSRNGAYYYEDFRKNWRRLIWVLYHGGLIALAVGLGAALAPQDGVGGQQGLRWAAAYIAFAAAAAEFVLAFRTVFRQNLGTSEGGGLPTPGRSGGAAAGEAFRAGWHLALAGLALEGRGPGLPRGQTK